MLNHFYVIVVALFVACFRAAGQEASSGFSVPLTVSGDVRYQQTHPNESGAGNSTEGGFRAVLYPTIKLNAHWFAYSALEVHSSRYFPYGTGSEENRPVQFDLMQAFVGYTTTVSKASLLVKVGQLSSAFGVFPLDYDDAKMPLIDAPPVYTTPLPLRPDQLPCGVNDILGQKYGSEVEYHCGGQDRERYGMAPVTLFGLPSAEAEISVERLDARLQLTNSSPVNPHGLTSESQSTQWTAGAGYTLPGGLHIGVSGFRGRYLDKTLDPLLPSGTTIRHFPASAVGADAEWSRGSWALQGEWQHFHFDLPNLSVGPSENAVYGQVKRIISPRLFLGMRATAQHFGRIQGGVAGSPVQFSGPQQVYELTVGYRLNRQQLLKVGGRWTNRSSWSASGWFWPETQGYTFEAQLVTSLTAVSKAFH
jgi:hypothetical protein